MSPYLTGFSTMGTVDAEDGTRVLDQELPVTANGLSGMTMIHHQLHSTRPTARSCVECHRASETWGMGSGNFRLGRPSRRGPPGGGPAYDPEPARAAREFVLPDVIDIEVRTDLLRGMPTSSTEGKRGVHAIDVAIRSRGAWTSMASRLAPCALGSHLRRRRIGGLKMT